MNPSAPRLPPLNDVDVFLEAANVRIFGPSGDDARARFLAKYKQLPKSPKRASETSNTWSVFLLELRAALILYSGATETAAAVSQQARRDALRDAINRHLKRLGPPQIDDNLRLSATAREFRDLLWLQLALAVSDQRHFMRCRVCGTFLELSRGGPRADREYCSTACKLRAYRKRKKEPARKSSRRVPATAADKIMDLIANEEADRERGDDEFGYKIFFEANANDQDRSK